MPFADAGGRIAFRLQCLCQSDLLCRKTPAGIREKDTPLVRAHAAPNGQASRQESGSRRGAERRSHIELGPLLTLLRHTIQSRRTDRRMAEDVQVSISQIIGKQDDEVRDRCLDLLFGPLAGRQAEQKDQRENQSKAHKLTSTPRLNRKNNVARGKRCQTGVGARLEPKAFTRRYLKSTDVRVTDFSTPSQGAESPDASRKVASPFVNRSAERSVPPLQYALAPENLN